MNFGNSKVLYKWGLNEKFSYDKYKLMQLSILYNKMFRKNAKNAACKHFFSESLSWKKKSVYQTA